MLNVERQIESVLIYDAVRLFALALQKHGKQIEPVSLDCHSGHTWEHGFSIINFMKNVSYFSNHDVTFFILILLVFLGIIDQ